MYLTFFNLKTAPFSTAPDPALLYQTASHQDAIAGLYYSIVSRKGFAALVGDAGTGKTTCIRAVLRKLLQTYEGRMHFAWIVNPLLSRDEFLEFLLLEFCGGETPPASRAQQIRKLQKVLFQMSKQDHLAILIVDEAHKLSPELLEEIRLITNIETAQGKLLQIVLAGQTELRGLLNREDLRQVKQRIAVRLRLEALDAAQVRTYVEHRWSRAGGSSPSPFDARAIDALTVFSAGIPRLINILCDNALLFAFSDSCRTVTQSYVEEAASELELSPVLAVRTDDVPLLHRKQVMA
jgi:general secretion pathway protein A